MSTSMNISGVTFPDGTTQTTASWVSSVAGNVGAVTATQVRDALLAVDGSGSGLDADLLDGQHGSYYAPASSLAAYVDNDIGVHGVGMIIFGALQGATTLASGATISGAKVYSIAYDSYSSGFQISGSPIGSGTWRNIGPSLASATVGSWFQRIS